jgi:hypothetical protein
MDATLITLKSHLQSYRKLDEDLKELNAKSLEVRRERKQIESEMSIILQKPEFQQYDKLEIKEDGSLIRIQRPGTWTKGWSMSKHELMDALNLYFKIDKDANAEDCYDFLVEHQKPKMISNEFAFERTIQSNPAKRNKYSM